MYRIIEVLTNLVGNAFKFTTKGHIKVILGIDYHDRIFKKNGKWVAQSLQTLKDHSGGESSAFSHHHKGEFANGSIH